MTASSSEAEDSRKPERTDHLQRDRHEEQPTAPIEEDRDVFRRHDREEDPAEGGQGDEHDRRSASLRGERAALVFKRDATAEQARHSRQAAPDAASAPRERAEHDGERREVFSRNDTLVGPKRVVEARAKREARGGVLRRPGERGWECRRDLDERELDGESAPERGRDRLDEPRQSKSELARPGAGPRVQPLRERPGFTGVPRLANREPKHDRAGEQEDSGQRRTASSSYGAPRSAESSAISVIRRAPLASRS